MKDKLHSFVDTLRIRYVLMLFVLSVPLAAYLLRQNNLTMIELRETVLTVDEETGSIEEVQPHLIELGEYILSHMNTDAGMIELPGSYNSEVERLRKRAERSGSANSRVYAQAQARCEDPNIPLTARAQCVQDYIVANAAPGTDPVLELELPDKALYSYSFSSPKWSADFAGFSVLLSASLFTVLVILIAARVVMPFFSRMVENDPLE